MRSEAPSSSVSPGGSLPPAVVGAIPMFRTVLVENPASTFSGDEAVDVTRINFGIRFLPRVNLKYILAIDLAVSRGRLPKLRETSSVTTT